MIVQNYLNMLSEYVLLHPACPAQFQTNIRYLGYTLFR